nr:MAG TPA: hypothetical protein [Crassvirales sp.]
MTVLTYWILAIIATVMLIQIILDGDENFF